MRPAHLIRLLGAAVLAVGLAAVPSVAHAHTDFDFSLPTDGASVAEPVDEITVGFTLPVTLIGPGFRVLTPAGDELTPFVVTDDDTVFRLQLDPPLAGGVVAVAWEVAAEDGHPLSGTFTFTVDAEPATTPTTEAPTSTTAPPVATTAPPVETTAAASVATTVPAVVAPPDTTTPTSETSVDDASVGEAASGGSTGSDGGGDRTGLYVAAAAAVALGAGAFLVLRPSPVT